MYFGLCLYGIGIALVCNALNNGNFTERVICSLVLGLRELSIEKMQ